MTFLRACLAVLVLVACAGRPRVALAQAVSGAMHHPDRHAESARDGVYDRFDGDLDLGLALGAEFGSGRVAPVLRGTAHYFSVAGVYALGRVRAGNDSARSLLGVGVDLRPLFLPRWAKGFETGPAFFDLTLDSLSLSLGAFWAASLPRGPDAARGFEAALGFGVPLFSTAGGPWLEARGALRYPGAEPREEAVLVALSWHGFVTTPLLSAD